jgi:pimeloyl-ACP methyl ester carboxylesterase
MGGLANSAKFKNTNCQQCPVLRVYFCKKPAMRFSFLFLFLFITCFSLHAQHIKRRGAIGIIQQPMNDSLAKSLGIDPENGVFVKSVTPGTAAEKMGVLANDVILKINDKVIRSYKDLTEISAMSIAGDPVKIELNRNKQILSKEGVILPRSMGYPDNVKIDLDEFPFENGYIRTILFRPNGSDTGLPVIYFIQGFPCFSMQYMQPDFPYRTAINSFVEKGYAVYVVEKPGMGDEASPGTENCSRIGFNKELQIFQKGYEKLLSVREIDKKKVFIFGHSLGGFIAPLIAAQTSPGGVIVYGCGLKPWHDYYLDLVREQEPLLGVDYADAEDSAAKYRAVFYKYFFENKSPEELIAEDPANREILKSALNFDGKDQLIQRHYSFWQELNRHNLARAWKDTKAPVLSIFGEADIAALKATDMVRITEIVNNYRPGTATYLFVPQTNHEMVKTGTMKENVAIQYSRGYNQYLKNNFNYELINDIDKWIKTQIR